MFKGLLAALILSYHMDQYIKLAMSSSRYRRTRKLS